MIENDITLIRGFLPAHQKCAWNNAFEFLHVKKLFELKSSIDLNEDEIETMWKILQEGF